VHNPWSKGTPNPAEFKLGSVYDYYDIYEELGRSVALLLGKILYFIRFTTF
jgi:hypothetical protein